MANVERLQSLWGGFGELFRVELVGHELSSVVVKLVAPPRGADGSRSHRRKLRSYEVERSFYARYGARCGSACRVPRFVAQAEDESGLLVLEDLDAAGYAGRESRVGPTEIGAGLAWLAAFHATFLGVVPEGLWRVGTYWHLATRPDELAATKHAELRNIAPALDARLNAARYQTFVHGDAKLANICFGSRGASVALVDFQYVGGGVGVKDVAYFLGCCLDASEQPALVPRYLELYFAELRAALEPRLPLAELAELAELEREWRALFPLAWLDFYRFLAGWAPGTYDPEPYGERLLRELGARLVR